MSGPDRIWAIGGNKGGDWGSRNGLCHTFGGTEYIRADLVQALIQAAIDIDSQYCDNDLGPSALAMGKLREAYMRLK